MFRHQGKRRTYLHNVKTAILLSFVAGFVNVSGFFAVGLLTTNVTGHFAFFIDGLFKWRTGQPTIYIGFIGFFFMGSLVSRLLSESTVRFRPALRYIAPVILEIVLIVGVGCEGEDDRSLHPYTIAYLLLFAMGVQNSLITSLSGATVRTTHLTGLFTDLGIDIADSFFKRKIAERKTRQRNMGLRLTIVGFFFLGGLSGGVCFVRFGMHSLFLPAGLLLVGAFYDILTISARQALRKRGQTES